MRTADGELIATAEEHKRSSRSERYKRQIERLTDENAELRARNAVLELELARRACQDCPPIGRPPVPRWDDGR